MLCITCYQIKEVNRILKFTNISIRILIFKLFKQVFHIHPWKPAGNKLPVSHLYHILFTHFRQNILNIVIKQLVRTEHDNITRSQITTVTIKQECNSLQNCTSFTRTCSTLNEKQVSTSISNNLILFLLNRSYD